MTTGQMLTVIGISLLTAILMLFARVTHAAIDPIDLRLDPSACVEPCRVTATATALPHPTNESIEIAVFAVDYSTDDVGAIQPSGGEYSILTAALSSGEYEVIAVLYRRHGSAGPQAVFTTRKFITVKPDTSDDKQ
jgi:hypothetical protein